MGKDEVYGTIIIAFFRFRVLALRGYFVYFLLLYTP